MPLLYYARQSQLKTKDGVKQWHLTSLGELSQGFVPGQL